ncbi:uncharacterized protein LAESUDRAFT_763097 [Laetiporus sulphureus 93-53]|uniref:Uncharacterized protein n=1 Tax=Laetiporus sulphureus 93-53 TaxID=1314785 RepID=A0A165C3T5_9APHY|nr:uncharacterized protein LAESUDRAFT_763097 [Laetiporus sulphureus 93-53]KZT02157.1 hypothetical protein LAESUDRAFT_763097 [Laetiporus sulphureus 93-53]
MAREVASPVSNDSQKENSGVRVRVKAEKMKQKKLSKGKKPMRRRVKIEEQENEKEPEESAFGQKDCFRWNNPSSRHSRIIILPLVLTSVVQRRLLRLGIYRPVEQERMRADFPELHVASYCSPFKL